MPETAAQPGDVVLDIVPVVADSDHNPPIGTPLENTAPVGTKYSEALTGFFVKYTFSNLPVDTLLEIMKYLDQSSLANASMVKSDWYLASKHDILWYDNCVGLFKKIYDEQINYYVSEMQRIGYYKPYGKPIPPPPKKPLVEDYVTFDNQNKIISIGTLRGLHIKHGKKQAKERRRIEKERKFREFKKKYHTKFQDNRDRFLITSITMLFISFLLFFIMTGITDAVDALIYNAIGVRWQLFTFLPLWFMFMVAYMIAGYFVTEDCLKEFRSGQWVAGALAMGLITSMAIVAVLTWINVLLPFKETVLPNGMIKRDYVISWFYVLIVPYLYVLVIMPSFPIGSLIYIKKREHSKLLHAWYAFGINVGVLLLEAFVIMLGFGLEFSDKGFYLMYSGIPLALFFIITFFVLLYYFIKYMHNHGWNASDLKHDGGIFIWFLVFVFLLVINVIVVSFSPFLGHYTWFSSLPPLTIAYAFTIKLLVKRY